MTVDTFAESWRTGLDALHAAELAGDGALAHALTEQLEDLAKHDLPSYEAMLARERAAAAAIMEL